MSNDKNSGDDDAPTFSAADGEDTPTGVPDRHRNSSGGKTAFAGSLILLCI